MHWILQILAVALVGASFGTSKTIEKRDESGTLRLKRDVREDSQGNQIRDGYEIRYYSDGSESSKFHYVNDELDGPWAEWYSGHKIKAQGAYRKGIKDGSEIHFLPSGEKLQQIDYKNGRREGKKIEWNAEGKKTFEADYVNDELNGKVQIWGSDGKPRAITTYLHGMIEGVQRTWHENGRLATEIEYLDGQKNGAVHQWFANTQLELQSHYRRGMLEGLVTQWYESGAKRSEATYANGQIQGTLTQWFDSPLEHPIVSMISNYEHGRINGLQATYYEKSGKKRLELMARDGMRQGPWAEWYETGQVKSKGIYKDDQLDGVVWFYFDDGKQWAINCYSKGARNGRWAELDADGKLIRDQYYSQGVLTLDALKKAAKDKEKEKAAESAGAPAAAKN